MIKTLSTKKDASNASTFSISTTAFGKFTAYTLHNDATGESAAIIPGCGAALNSLVLRKENLLFETIDGNANEQYLLGEGAKDYNGKILFPYPNRTKGGLYIFEGKMYHFDINDGHDWQNSLHGLCAEANFEVVNQDIKKTKASLQIKYKLDGKHHAYPFEILLTVVYELSKKGLAVWTEVHNLGSKTAPFGLGWHPYFKTGSKVDDLEMWLPQHYELQVDEQLIPTSKISEGYSFTSYESISSITLDNGYMINPDLIQASVKINDPIQGFYIELACLKGYDYLQVYTPNHRNSIAIEPQTCAADAFNNKMGLVELMPNEKRNFAFSIGIG